MKKLSRSEKAFRSALCELLQTSDLDKIRVKQICQKAEFSNMAFYSHYEDKYALAISIMDHEIDVKLEDSKTVVSMLRETGTYTHKNMMYEVSLKFFDRVYANPQIYGCIFENRLMPDAMKYFSSSVSKKYHEIFVIEGNALMAEYSKYLYELITMNLLSAAKLWFQNGFDISSRSYARLYSTYMTDWSTNIITGTNEIFRIAE